MSAIAGIIGAADRRPPAEAAVRRMLSAMAHRAPDGMAAAKARGAVLGHGALRTLDEDESQPIADGGLSITADLRLDNRADLIRALGVRDKGVSDARLVLLAYKAWGEACAERLLGDFAFAIWNAETGVLFAARDFIGVKPFYYHPGEAGLVFASEVKGVLAEGSASHHIREARIAEFLAGFPPPEDQTLYEAVLRLPAAHALTWKGGGVTLRRYWRPPETPAHRRPDSAEQFAAILRQAVQDRMRGPGPLGALLSGGLDSSAICGLAAPLEKSRSGKQLPTVSVVFDKTPELSERPFIEAVLERGGFDPTFMDGSQASPIRRLEPLIALQDGLFLGHNIDLTSSVYRACAGRGLKVVLNGHGGDEVVSQGYGRLHELAMAKRWSALWREVKGASDIFGGAPWPMFLGYFERHGVPHRVLPLWRKIRRRLEGSAAPQGHAPWSTIINPDLAKRTSVRELRLASVAASRQALTQRDHHLATTDPRLQSYAFEILDRTAAAHGIEARHPFWDQRLLEFCLTVPPEEILGDGWPRLILRRAMEGVMPPKVQWRRDKLDFTPHLAADMAGDHRGLIEAIINADAEDIGAYVDLSGARAAWSRLAEQREAAHGYDVQFVWRTVAFALWLKAERAGPGGASIG